jgi:type I restriction enzyme M protein
MPPKPKTEKSTNGKGKPQNGANLGFEAQLFLAADKLRGNLEPSDYKHVALGLIFLKYISDAFEAKRTALLAEDPKSAEDPDEYLAENVFWVPKDARWSHLQAKAKQPTIGKLIDDAMMAIESNNASLKGVLPKDYNRPALNKVMLGELIDLISGIAMHEKGEKAKDILGRVYEYFSWRLCRIRRQTGRRILHASLCSSGPCGNAGTLSRQGAQNRRPGL